MKKTTTYSPEVRERAVHGVLNKSDLVTKVSQAFPTLPIVVLDHYDGLVANNVMCLDKPWRQDDVEEKVLTMVTRLPECKRPHSSATD